MNTTAFHVIVSEVHNYDFQVAQLLNNIFLASQYDTQYADEYEYQIIKSLRATVRAAEHIARLINAD